MFVHFYSFIRTHNHRILYTSGSVHGSHTKKHTPTHTHTDVCLRKQKRILIFIIAQLWIFVLFESSGSAIQFHAQDDAGKTVVSEPIRCWFGHAKTTLKMRYQISMCVCVYLNENSICLDITAD